MAWKALSSLRGGLSISAARYGRQLRVQAPACVPVSRAGLHRLSWPRLRDHCHLMLLVTRKCQACRNLRRLPQVGGASRSPEEEGWLPLENTLSHTILVRFATNFRYHVHQSHQFILQCFGRGSKRQGLMHTPCFFGTIHTRSNAQFLTCSAG